MNRFFAALVAFAFLSSAFAQEASQQVSFSTSPDRQNILSTSLALHESEANLFWPIYEQYELRLNALKASTVQSLKDLISADEASAADNVLHLLQDQHREANLKKEYFEKIVQSTNGTIALEFLQGETLFDLLLKTKLYEEVKWFQPLWTPAVLTNESVRQTITEFSLGVLSADSAAFRSLMNDFLFEYSRVVGHEYVFFEQYIDDANEWTPGQCRKLGQDFITMQLNEVKVKERFFEQFSKDFGPAFAARFIGLQEYFNMMSKLKVWSDFVSLSNEEQR